MPPSGVGGALLAYGRELEQSGSAQVGQSFTSDVEASRLVESEPNAFLFGVLFTQGIPAERAWAGPAELLRRIGTIDPEYLATHADEVARAVQQPPMLHRFKDTLPRWIVGAAALLVNEYGGDASNIWPSGDHVLTVTDRLLTFPGIGRKKAVMAVEILMRHFHVELEGRESGTVAYDVHVRRVFLRSGLAEADSPVAIEAAARRICPDAPGTLDLAAWLVGRDTCRPKSPRCDACRLGQECPRLITLDAVGVGGSRS